MHTACMQDPAQCRHEHTRLVAQDDAEKYLECLDCGAILEAGEIEKPDGFDESLSDA